MELLKQVRSLRKLRANLYRRTPLCAQQVSPSHIFDVVEDAGSDLVSNVSSIETLAPVLLKTHTSK